MKRGAAVLAVLVLLLSGCGGGEAELPAPEELFSAIEDAVELPEMVDAGGEYLEDLTGIGPELYDGAVCFLLAEGTAPDELIIIRAKDEDAAQEVQRRLEDRLAYKERAVEQYLTEYQPMVKDGCVRQDGLTVSLIVSERAAEIAAVYEER